MMEGNNTTPMARRTATSLEGLDLGVVPVRDVAAEDAGEQGGGEHEVRHVAEVEHWHRPQPGTAGGEGELPGPSPPQKGEVGGR